MGLYLNPGNDAFRMAVNDDIYKDKSEMIAFTNQKMNKNKRFICVSRPRRFGKSMTAQMLAAYYSRGCDSVQLFQGLKISEKESFGEHLNQHDVIYLNIQQFLSDFLEPEAVIGCIEAEVIRELKEAYEGWFTYSPLGLPNVLAQIYQNDTREKKGFVFIIDEWDCLFRETKNKKDLQKKYLDFLKQLFKDRTYVSLAYMTGILPIKKYGTHSAINIFDEYSMMNPRELVEYTGFTEDEVMELCRRYERDFAEVKKWYDGYRFMGQWNIYNPKSVVDVMQSGEFDSYWTETETYEALKVYIEMDYDGLKTAVVTMLGGGRCRINPRRFQNDMTTFKTKDDVLTLLVHLGYLAYDKKQQEVYIPNQEIASEFMNAVDEPAWDGMIQAISRSRSLLNATLALDAEAVADGMDAIHTETASLLKYNDENSLACSVFMAYYSARSSYMPPIREFPSGKGFADIVYLPRKEESKPALLIELKWDQSAETAIRQIKEKGYADTLKNYAGNILLVGINYDKKNKCHQCVIEEYKMIANDQRIKMCDKT